METIIGLIVFAVIYLACKSSFNNKVDNYDISKVNTSKMVADKVNNNLSHSQVQRNMINGKYDYKPGEYNVYTGKRQ